MAVDSSGAQEAAALAEREVVEDDFAPDAAPDSEPDFEFDVAPDGDPALDPDPDPDLSAELESDLSAEPDPVLASDSLGLPESGAARLSVR